MVELELHLLTRIFLSNKRKVWMVGASGEKSSCWYCVMTMTANRAVTVQDKTEKPNFSVTLSLYELLPS